MKIDKSNHDDYAVLTLKGEFDTFYCPMLQQEVETLVERGVSHILLDLRLVKFINSTALGAIIKAHKRCRAEGGDLVISRPSSFVRDVITKVGIDKLIMMYDSEEEATHEIVKHLNKQELSGEAPVDDVKVLIAFPDETRNKMLGKRSTLVGTMANVDDRGLQFTWEGKKRDITQEQASQLFFAESDIHLKFQVKMIKKSFFDVTGKVTSTEASGDGVRVQVQFDAITEPDREALSQFAQDMAYLKRQLPGA